MPGSAGQPRDEVSSKRAGGPSGSTPARCWVNGVGDDNEPSPPASPLGLCLRIRPGIRLHLQHIQRFVERLMGNVYTSAKAWFKRCWRQECHPLKRFCAFDRGCTVSPLCPLVRDQSASTQSVAQHLVNMMLILQNSAACCVVAGRSSLITIHLQHSAHSSDERATVAVQSDHMLQHVHVFKAQRRFASWASASCTNVASILL
jgi:hypothetical protein